MSSFATFVEVLGALERYVTAVETMSLDPFLQFQLAVLKVNLQLTSVTLKRTTLLLDTSMWWQWTNRRTLKELNTRMSQVTARISALNTIETTHSV